MRDLITIRLGRETRLVLAQEAKTMGVPFRTLLRTIAEQHAVEARKRQIKAQGRVFVESLKRSAAYREFFEDWGTPTAHIDD